MLRKPLIYLDHSLFTKSSSDTFTIILVYVDDIILAGNSMYEFTNVKSILHASFKIKDLGQLKYYLGLEVAHSQQGISHCQRKYCLDLLADSSLTYSKPISTPSDPSVKLHHDSSSPYEDISSYRRLIDRLLYLNTKRPDITFITQQLSQFLTKPTQVHYIAANLVFHKCIKHLEIDCYLVRDKLHTDMIKLLPITSQAHIADFFTKATLPRPFHVLLSKLGMVDIYHPPTCGGYYIS